MTCQMCQDRVKDWSGSDPKCSFEDGVFNRDGWNCATANAIRDICYEGQTPMPDGVCFTFCDDDEYATIKTDHIRDDDDDEDDEPWMAICLWVQWYKNRGRTEEMLLLGGGEPRPPTEEECRRIIDVYK